MIDNIVINASGERVLIFADGADITKRVTHLSVSLVAGKPPLVRLELRGLTLELTIAPNPPHEQLPEQQPGRDPDVAPERTAESSLPPDSAPPVPAAEASPDPQQSKKPEPPMFTDQDDGDDIPFGKPAPRKGKPQPKPTSPRCALSSPSTTVKRPTQAVSCRSRWTST